MAAPVAMFTLTPKIENAIRLINDLQPAKFPLLLTRILNKLHLKDETTFNDDEERRLQSSLDLSPSQLQSVIETCEFIYHQAAYHTAKPALLRQQLQTLKLSEEKVEALVAAWCTSAAELVQKLKHRRIASKQLEDVSWRLGLQMAQSNLTKQKLPNAIFDLKVLHSATQKTDHIKMEFTHDELYSFYDQLEEVQAQLDSLT